MLNQIERDFVSPPPPTSAFSTSGANLIPSSNTEAHQVTSQGHNESNLSASVSASNSASDVLGDSFLASNSSAPPSDFNPNSSFGTSASSGAPVPAPATSNATISANSGLASPPNAVSLTNSLNLKKTTDAALEYGDADLAAIKTSSNNRENRNFYLKQELKGHTGAIYAIQFSPCGKFVATGSFDKTVRIWEGPSTATTQKELSILKRHTLNISDLCWSEDSSLLLSGGYDQTCKTWDVENGKFLESFDCDGFVQCVMFNPADKNQFYFGTTRNVLGMTDRRKPESAISIHNDGMINSVHVFKDNSYVLTADSNGFLKTWDVRTGKTVQVVLNEPTRKPISHISVCPMTNAEEEPRYIGINSYDNVMRVYDRGLNPPDNPPRMVHALKGHKNKNWPIKSSFHRLKDGGSSTKRTGSTDDLYSKGESLFDVPDSTDKCSDPIMLLATGSADPYVYIYGISATQGANELIQKLEGHTDRVYATSFHPTEGILASCSADCTVKFWYSGRRKARQL
ncbi:WD40-repeat-containing domain protein [Obelidium mucronatum]|nr:WD40-repeat-containing domain protein [Obelidium mucronatum]